MLKGIPEIIGSDLLKALADMGHGDILVIADHFYPPYSKSPNAVSIQAKGKGIILISSYLPEVMGLSDRLFVMAQGRITGEFNYDEIKVLKEEDVLKKASVEG